jgi:hypothetical protein
MFQMGKNKLFYFIYDKNLTFDTLCGSFYYVLTQMEDSSVELNEWWELAKVQFKEKMTKKLATHKKDEDK